MKKVAVTGGTGCIGRALVDKLIALGFDVNLLVRHPDTPIHYNKEKVTVYKGDVESYEVLKDLTLNCDVVFHLAGKVHTVPRSYIEKQNFYRINVGGTRNLLEASKTNNVRRVVFFSTVGVYGCDSDFHGDEISLCNPQTDYAKSKLQAEKIIMDSCNQGGPDGVILRFPVVYGPGDRGNIARLIKAVRRRLFVFFGDGNSLRSMISSKNASHVAIKAAFVPNASNQVFCATDGRDYTLNEVIEKISLALDLNWRPLHLPMALSELAGQFGDFIERVVGIAMPLNSERVRKLSASLTFSNAKAESVLGYQALETFEQGISREVYWLNND